MTDRDPDAHNDEPLVESEPTLVYRPGAEPEPAAVAARVLAGAFRFALVIERGPHAGLAYILGEGATTAGRAEDADIFLGDVTVSRHHAKFVVDGHGLTVEDLGSTNGTYVNLERRDRAPLQHGDEVIIGKFHLTVTRGKG